MNTRTARYRRHIDGADFSLEANTDATPKDGYYYVLRGGEVVLRSHNLRKAQEAYDAFCREHWLGSLESGSSASRLSSAWGLIGLEPSHTLASAVIAREGSDQDRARLGRMQQYQQPVPEEPQSVGGSRAERRRRG
jgi:hypothetical protein